MISTDPDALLARIVAWAEGEPNVLAVIMTGSRARIGATPDEFSDHDIEIISRDPGMLSRDDGWWRAFGNVWIHLPLSKGQRHPTRLVFYDGGLKVDFSLCGVERVREMVEARALDALYERGYRVLVDKVGVTDGLPAATGAFPARRVPAQEEFAAVAEEFWFEAAHIPRYLLRDELWVVKFRDWTMKSLLLQMLEWHAIARNAQPVDVWHIGSHMKDWVDAATASELHTIFSRFDTQSSWQDLLATTKLFRRIGRETAALVGLTYPIAADESIAAYVAGFADRIAAIEKHETAK